LFQQGDFIMANEPRPSNEPTPAAPPQAPQQFPLDTASLSTVYANFCRVQGTPEELIMDFGLNTQMTPVAGEPVKLSHRLVMNYFTAKRLLGALHMAVQQHEGVYGVLEVDVQKRVRPGLGMRPGLGGGGFQP
jgi:hypothetical protein